MAFGFHRGDNMQEIRKEEFAPLFEELISEVTNPEQKGKAAVRKLVREMCEYFHITKAVTEFYKSLIHEKRGDGEVIIGYDNGKGNVIAHRRRIITRSMAVIQGTLYVEKQEDILEGDDLRRADLALRSVLSYISRNRLQYTIETFAFYDDAGYRNIRFFMRHLLQLREKRGDLSGHAAVRLNIRRFTLVNKDMGRKGGDMALKNYYGILDGCVGENGTLCRIGGDNFIAFMEEKYLSGFISKLKGTTVNCGEDSKRIVLTASAGVVNISGDSAGMTPEEIMDTVSSVAGMAKNSSDENIIYFDSMMLRRKERVVRIQDLFADALENREFAAFYQPKVDIMTGKVVGAEALCRWFHEGTLVMPADFIPVLEMTNDICRLDYYMLDTVCRDIRRWLDTGTEPVRVSVNLSRKHLTDADLLKTIFGIIDRNRVPHKYIEIELTETTGFVEFDVLRQIICSLQDAGVSASVDDFGMGYSSLNLIREIPWNVLKVDRCFLPLDTEDEKSITRLMFKHVINMALDLGLECIAEGVETDRQVDVLRENGCTIAQGFYFDRPLPMDEFEKKLRDFRYTV